MADVARFRVTAPYVTAPTAQAAHLVRGLGTNATVGAMGFTRGAILPGDVPPEHIDHLVRHGLVERIEQG